MQYADDTLILLRATKEDVGHLKLCLDRFAEATGLKINFHKSTIVPMHVPENVVDCLVTILQCKRDTFPQTYLGLPLSNSKLRLSAFAPLIAKVDKYLAGWKATLLSPAGRVVVINSVLDGLPIYTMGALLLPVGVKEALDARRRSFLWNGSDKASAQCLVAWEKVCAAKEDGGLGYRFPNRPGPLGRHGPGAEKHGTGPVRHGLARARAWAYTPARSAGTGMARSNGQHGGGMGACLPLIPFPRS